MKTRAIAASLLLIGCASPVPEGLSFARPFGAAPVPGTIIDSVPSGAVLIHPGGECTTPCRVDYGESVEVTLAREGYRPLRLIVPLGASDATFELEPVGRSTPVEEESLPLL